MAAAAAPVRKRAKDDGGQKLRKSEATRARILDAAAFVFQQNGYALARLSDIAKRARTQTGSIYYYFASRDAIVAEVLQIANDRTVQFVREHMAALPEDAPVRERIEAAIHGHLALVLSGDNYARAHMRILDQVPKKVREHFLRVLDEYADVWRDLFAEARHKGEFRADVDLSVARLLLLGMLNWAVEWFRPGRLTVNQIAHQAATLFLQGVGQPNKI